MKVLSVRQPWAWLIVNGYKDVENREWSTTYRGPLLIHASKKHDPRGADMAGIILRENYPQVHWPAELPVGCIVGRVTLQDCLPFGEYHSPWSFGRFNFVLRDATPLPPLMFTGKLGLFNVDIEELDQTWWKNNRKIIAP